jgi:hypothetical protein
MKKFILIIAATVISCLSLSAKQSETYTKEYFSTHGEKRIVWYNIPTVPNLAGGTDCLAIFPSEIENAEETINSFADVFGGEHVLFSAEEKENVGIANTLKEMGYICEKYSICDIIPTGLKNGCSSATDLLLADEFNSIGAIMIYPGLKTIQAKDQYKIEGKRIAIVLGENKETKEATKNAIEQIKMLGGETKIIEYFTTRPLSVEEYMQSEDFAKDMRECYQFIKSAASIEDLPADSFLETSEKVTFKTSNHSTAQIYSITGENVSASSGSGEMTILKENLAPGVYFVTVSENNKIYRKKFMVRH